MKLVVKREPFLKAFSRVSPIAAGRQYKPELSSVLLTANNGHSSLQATDTEMAALCLIGAEIAIEAGGKALLPASLFGNILRESQDDELLLKLNGRGVLEVKGHSTEYAINTLSPSEFPEPPDIKTTGSAKLAAAIVSTALSAVSLIPEAQFKSWRIDFVCVELSEKSIAFVGTDGKAIGTAEYDITGGAECRALLTAKAAKMASRAAAAEGGDVEMRFSSNWISFDTPTFSFMARLGDGAYPKWREFRCYDAKQGKICVPAGVVSAAIRRASLTADQQSDLPNDARLSLDNGTFSVSTDSKCVGSSRASFPADYSGPALNVRMNWRYLQMALSPFGEDELIELSIGGPSDSVDVRRENFFFGIQPRSEDRT